MNTQAFKDLIKKYRSYTLESLFNEVINYLKVNTITSKNQKIFTWNSNLYMEDLCKSLTGYGSQKTCILCKYGYKDCCKNCIHHWLKNRELRPEKKKNNNRSYACITPSYDAIENSKTVKDLHISFQKRADYLEECLNIYIQEVKNE